MPQRKVLGRRLTDLSSQTGSAVNLRPSVCQSLVDRMQGGPQIQNTKLNTTVSQSHMHRPPGVDTGSIGTAGGHDYRVSC